MIRCICRVRCADRESTEICGPHSGPYKGKIIVIKPLSVLVRVGMSSVSAMPTFRWAWHRATLDSKHKFHQAGFCSNSRIAAGISFAFNPSPGTFWQNTAVMRPRAIACSSLEKSNT